MPGPLAKKAGAPGSPAKKAGLPGLPAKKAGPPGPLSPEQVIALRMRRLADREEVASFLTKSLWMAAFLYVLFGVLFGITVMKNNDMSPKLSSGDLLFYYRLEDSFRSDDVVVFEKDGRQNVGRVVAKGGDSVEVTEDSQLVINNSYVSESDIFYPTQRYADEVAYPLQLSENQYFILCDYREGAKDSRYFGAVDGDEIRGKVLMIIRRSDL